MNKLKAFYNHPQTQSVLLTIACFYALFNEHVVLGVLIASLCIAKTISDTPHHAHMHQDILLQVPKDADPELIAAFYKAIKNHDTSVEFSTCPENVEPKEE